MTLLSKIKLSWLFGKVTYLISAVISLSMAVVVAVTPGLMPVCIILKIISAPIIYYLNSSLTVVRSRMYFYLNLGISRMEYHSIPFIVEFAIFVFLVTISGIIGHAIG